MKKTKKILPFLTSKYSPYLLILIISFSSLWLLLFYFFSWEEFSFFYAYQFADGFEKVFQSHGFLNHPLLPHLGFLFYLFDYNPLPYNILSLLSYFLLCITFYLFIQKIFSFEKKLALYSTIIFSAGYFGIGTFITDTYSGFNGGFGIIFEMLSIVMFKNILNNFTPRNFIFFIVIYLFSIKYFAARTFLLPPLLFIILLFHTRNFLKIILYSLVFSVPLLVLLKYQSGVFTSALPFIDIKASDFVRSVLGNVGNSFLPTLIISKDLVSILIGFVIVTIGLLKKNTRLLTLLLISSIGSMLFAILINSQYFTIWKSDNHYFTSFTIFSAPIIALFFKRSSKIIIIIVVFILALSNIQGYKELIDHSNNLRYFYETIQKDIPRSNEKKVIVIFTKEPRPLNPFIHLPQISPELYLAGFYHKRASELPVYQSYEEAERYLNENKLGVNNLYVFLYSHYNLQNVSEHARNILLMNKQLTIRNPKDTSVSGVIPFTISYEISEQNNGNLTNQDAQVLDYLQWADKINIKTTPSISHEDRKKEYLTDHDYETTWIPGKWENPIVLEFNFPERKEIKYIAWAVSRLSSWPQRTPTTYSILVTEDGRQWILVKNIEDGKGLFSNQIKNEEINFLDPIIGVRFEVYKTLEGALPAFDEIEFISKDIYNLGYDKISELIIKNQKKVCLQWKTNEDNEFRIQRQICQKNSGNKIYKTKIEARSLQVTGFRIVDINEKELQMKNIKIEFPKI